MSEFADSQLEFDSVNCGTEHEHREKLLQSSWRVQKALND